MPIQIHIENFTTKKENFQIKKCDIIHISAKNIDSGYSLEPPRRDGSNEYSQSMFVCVEVLRPSQPNGVM